MNSTRYSSVIALLLAAIMAFTFIAGIESEVFAVSESEIESMKAQIAAYELQMKEQQAVIEELESQQADVVERKLAMDQRDEALKQKIDILKEEIAVYEILVAEKSQEVTDAKEREEKQLQLYRARVRAMEERGSFNILTLIFQAESLPELLCAIDDMNEIMENDRAQGDAYIAARQQSEKVQAEYQAYKEGLEADKDELEIQQAVLKQQREEAAEMLKEIEANIQDAKDQYALMEQSEAEAYDAVQSMIAEYEEQQRAALAWQNTYYASSASSEYYANTSGGSWVGGNTSVSASGSSSGYYYPGGTVTSTNGLAWPSNSTYVTSDVGTRVHPITGETKQHTGIDIGCNYGDPVMSAGSGTVIMAGENGGYGNCVIVDHGNGMYTLYGHLDSINVIPGQTVEQGQDLGGAGSTGMATGPHLHYEIRDNSGCTDFSDAYSGLSYAEDSGH